MKKILFVCTQNVTRSMSAHYLMQKYLDENGIDGYEIDSAGTHACCRESSYSQVLDALYELGVDARNHVQKRLDEDLVNSSDLIIASSKHHQEFIRENFNVESYLFNEIAYGRDTDLQDDVEADFTSLDDFLRQLVRCINDAIPHIVENMEDYMD